MENEIMNGIEEQVMSEGTSTKGEGAMAALILVGCCAVGHLAADGIKKGFKHAKTWVKNRRKPKGVIEIDNTVEEGE